MIIRLNQVDVRVLDLIADDYYGLWEVCDYFVQLMPNSTPAIARRKCRTRVQTYFREGLIDVFVGTMSKSDFRKVDKKAVSKILAQDSSWRTPRGLTEVVAIIANEKAEKQIANYPLD